MDVVKYPDPFLRQPAERLAQDEIDDAFRETIDDMFDTMYRDRGIGLAAVQVGIGKRFFICNLQTNEDRPPPREGVDPDTTAAHEHVFINPDVLEINDEQVAGEEGCLSIPGVRGDVMRPTRIVLRALDRHGKEFTTEATGWFARCCLHEIDHLDGVLFIDKAPGLTEANRKLLNEQREAYEAEQRKAKKLDDKKKKRRVLRK